jgi:hypothetical protein
MARIRSIKPDFWKHEVMCSQPECVRLFALAMLNYADDYGYFNANHKLIEAECFPLAPPSIPVTDMIERLCAIEYIELGTGPDGRRYGRVVKWGKHQRVQHPSKLHAEGMRKLAITWDAPASLTQDSRKPHEAVTSHSRKPHECLTPDRDREGEEDGFRLNKNSDSQYGTKAPRKQTLVIEKIATASLKHINSMDPKAARNGTLSVLATVPHSSPAEPVDAIGEDEGHMGSSQVSETIQ